MSTSFAPISFPVPRAERAPSPKAAAPVASARAASSLLLAAIVSALLVVANQVVDTWTEGHLLAAWIVLWVVAFAALALLAAPARRAATALRASFVAWNERRIQDAQDEQYWQAALNDARLMADISRAMSAAALRDVKTYY
jgi:hypothetical protein